MIIVCPECQSRYKVPAETISVSGREMKCANCSHQWFQEGAGFQDMLGEVDLDGSSGALSDDSIDEKLSQIEEALIKETGDDLDSEEYSASDESDDDDRAASDIGFVERDVRDDEKKTESSTPEPAKAKPFVPKKRKKVEVSGSVFSGAFVGLIAFVSVSVVLLFMKDTVIENAPFTKPLYVAMGFKVPVAGEGLVFDGVETSWKDSKLRVQGKIVNLQMGVSEIPRVELGFVDINGDILDRSIFSVDSSEIQGEHSMPFEYEIQAMPSIREQTYSVKLKFLPSEE